MDIAKSLVKNRPVLEVQKIANHLIRHPEKIPDFLKIYLSENTKESQRAAWVLGIIGEEAPELVQPYLKKLLPVLEKPVHDGVKRGLLRALQFMELPEKLEVKILESCFALLQHSAEPPAIKAFSITVIARIAEKYPEIKSELAAWYAGRKEQESKAVKKRMEKAGII